MDKPLSHFRGGGRFSDKPSFASTLLDSVYRSIDEDNSDIGPFRKHDSRVLQPYFPSVIGDHITATQREGPKSKVAREKVIPQHRAYTYTSSSSSENSSYGGFSSSDETVPRHQIGAPARIAWSGPLPEKKKSKAGSIRSKLRDLRRTRAPVSPGARLANFLNSIFTASMKKVPKETEKPVYSPASRPCLAKTGSLRERSLHTGGLNRSVRFDPVKHKVIRDGEGLMEDVQVDQGSKRKDTVGELLQRRFEEEDEDDDDDDVGSNSSSDLFELENLIVGVEAGGGYRDELPVFKTTNIGALRAPSLRF